MIALLFACGTAAVGPEVAPIAITRANKTPVPQVLDARTLAARERLRAIVKARALDPGNPWAIKHAWLAVDVATPLSDGTDAVDTLFARHAKPVRLGGRDLIEFPAIGDGADVRVEPHTDLLLKGLADGGVSPDRVVNVGGVDHPIADLWRASLYRAWIDGETTWTPSWNDTPWALHGLAAWAPPGLAWTAEGGRAMTIDKLTHGVVAKLHDETQFLRDASAKGQRVQKRKQGIFAYTCGGAHLLQGAAFAVARGHGEPGDRALIEAEVPTLFFRYEIELATVDAALEQFPEHTLILLVQRQKWLGHFLESAHALAAEGFYVPDAEQQALLARAATDLADTTERLDAYGALDQLDAINARDHQLYLDLLGDAAHAVHGLDLAAGDAVVRY